MHCYNIATPQFHISTSVQLRDAMPCPPQHYELHKNWVISAAQWEQVYSKRDNAITDEYDRKAFQLDQLEIGSNVAIYNQEE